MDLLDEWAIKIAEVAAPEEVDLAVLIIQAFVRDREARNKPRLG